MLRQAARLLAAVEKTIHVRHAWPRHSLGGASSIVIIRRDTSSRRERIVALLREHGSVQIPALVELFGVSTQTLRKDLNFLDSKRICTRTPGGAMLNRGTGTVREDAVDVKRTLFA